MRPSGLPVCYGCGESGHFRRSCPTQPRSTSVYPLPKEFGLGMNGDSHVLEHEGEACEQLLPNKQPELSPKVLPCGELLPGVFPVVDTGGVGERCWEFHFYVFAVLPFGLASAPYVFTKLLRPPVRLWRAGSLKAVNDGIVSVQDEEEAKKASGWVRDNLQKSGFVVNNDKSVWTPSHSLTWLGFEINLQKGQVTVPMIKIHALQATLQDALTFHSLQARCIASIVGKILSMSLALGPVARFMTRNLYALLEFRYAWCDSLELSPPVRMKLEFWAGCLQKYNSQPIWHTPSAVRVYSRAQGLWSSEGAVQSPRGENYM